MIEYDITLTEIETIVLTKVTVICLYAPSPPLTCSIDMLTHPHAYRLHAIRTVLTMSLWVLVSI